VLKSGHVLAGRAAELAVPRVGEFVRQQFAPRLVLVPFGEVAELDAVLARLVMLAADAAEFIADGEQEVVVLVVLRVEQLVGLLHQRAVRGDLFRRGFQLLGRIGHHVQAHRNLAPGSRSIWRK
jgi:hypothetical protein